MPAKLFTILTIALSLWACGGGEEKVNVRLTMEERNALDRRISTHMDSLRTALNEYCERTLMDRVAIATDSIVQVRLEEEARMRARLNENLPQR